MSSPPSEADSSIRRLSSRFKMRSKIPTLLVGGRPDSVIRPSPPSVNDSGLPFVSSPQASSSRAYSPTKIPQIVQTLQNRPVSQHLGYGTISRMQRQSLPSARDPRKMSSTTTTPIPVCNECSPYEGNSS
jgi:hypothetical protein